MTDKEKYSLDNLREFNSIKTDNFLEEDDSFLSNLDFIKFLIVARKNLPWLILILSFTLAASYIYNRYTKAIYESSSIIKLDIKRDNTKLLGIGGASNDVDQSVLSGEIELLRSNLIYDLALKIIDLRISYYAKGNITYEERYKNAPFEVVCDIIDPSYYNTNFYVEILDKDTYILTHNEGSEQVSKRLSFLEKYKTNGFELFLKTNFKSNEDIKTSDFFFKVNSQEYLMNLLASNINIEILNQQANTIKISFKDFNPSKAKDIVAAIDSVYTIESLQRKYKTQEQSLRFLESQLSDVELKLNDMESKLEQF
ncbi:MAG: hypothetical protein K2Q22_06475, partial [Cytophagales bacterium]|nr:hypothetical protein [Cytophagales bacterium]